MNNSENPWLSQDDIDVILDLKKAHVVLGELSELLPDGHTGTFGALIAGYRDLVNLLEKINERTINLARDIENEQRGTVADHRLSKTSHLTIVKTSANVDKTQVKGGS